MSDQPLLDVRGLAILLSGPRGKVRAIHDVTYSVPPGQAVGIVGESGSGKSLSCLALLRLTGFPSDDLLGEVRFEGADLLRIPKKELRRVRGGRIGMVFQDPASSLNPTLRIGTQLTEPLRLHTNMNRTQRRLKALELMEMVGIPSPAVRIDSYPHEFSGGMRQRVAIAMALAANPALLIADEPTTALDVTVQAQIVGLMRGLREEQRLSLVWVSHDLGVVASLVDRVIVMYAGTIVEDAPVDALYSVPLHPYTEALLHAVAASSDEEGEVIPGRPPSLVDLPSGCAFADRCRYALNRCREAPPDLLEVGPSRRVACWVDITTGRERATTSVSSEAGL